MLLRNSLKSINRHAIHVFLFLYPIEFVHCVCEGHVTIVEKKKHVLNVKWDSVGSPFQSFSFCSPFSSFIDFIFVLMLDIAAPVGSVWYVQ